MFSAHLLAFASDPASPSPHEISRDLNNWGVLIRRVFMKTQEMYVATCIMVKTFFPIIKLSKLNWLIAGPWNTYFLRQVRRETTLGRTRTCTRKWQQTNSFEFNNISGVELVLGQHVLFVERGYIFSKNDCEGMQKKRGKWLDGKAILNPTVRSSIPNFC